jgi:hypothetical protein
MGRLILIGLVFVSIHHEPINVKLVNKSKVLKFISDRLYHFSKVRRIVQNPISKRSRFIDLD